MINKSRILVLFFVLLFAFLLRFPQINFPSIGYHNMKENEYISIAKNMLSGGDFVNRNIYFYNGFGDKKDFGLYPQIPFVAYQVVLGYRLFGENLWFPRLVNVIFMLLSIICIFYLTFLFTSEYVYSISAAILLSVLPLGYIFLVISNRRAAHSSLCYWLLF